MKQEERREICHKAKICLTCLSTVVTFSSTHLTDCQRKKDIRGGSTNEYCCMVNNCYARIGTCVIHKSDPTNAANIKKRRDQMSQRGWTMGMVTIMNTISTSNQTLCLVPSLSLASTHPSIGQL